jgi:hypothetical protein
LLSRIKCEHLDWQVASAVQFFGTLSPVLSTVEKVTFGFEEHKLSSEWHNNVSRRQWRELLRPFTNAKTIQVQDDLVSKIFRSLPSDDGEPPLELLPNLEEVGFSGESNALDAFPFLNEREAAGHLVSLRLVDSSMFYEPFGSLRLSTTEIQLPQRPGRLKYVLHTTTHLSRAHIVTPVYSLVHDNRH